MDAPWNEHPPVVRFSHSGSRGRRLLYADAHTHTTPLATSRPRGVASIGEPPLFMPQRRGSERSSIPFRDMEKQLTEAFEAVLGKHSSAPVMTKYGWQDSEDDDGLQSELGNLENYEEELQQHLLRAGSYFSHDDKETARIKACEYTHTTTTPTTVTSLISRDSFGLSRSPDFNERPKDPPVISQATSMCLTKPKYHAPEHDFASLYSLDRFGSHQSSKGSYQSLSPESSRLRMTKRVHKSLYPSILEIMAIDIESTWPSFAKIDPAKVAPLTTTTPHTKTPPTCSHQHENSEQNKTRSSRQTPDFHRSVIEVTPGVFVDLVGADETMDAVRSSRTTKCGCMICEALLLCKDIVSLVLCPDCQTISPVDSVYSRGAAMVGLGCHAMYI